MTTVVRARLTKAVAIGLIAVAWYSTAEVVTHSALPVGQDGQLWIPSGLAMAIVVVLGPWAALGVLIGACAYWFTRSASVGTTILIALIDTGEALAGAYLLTHVSHVRYGLTRVRDVLGLLATVLIVTATSAMAVTLVMIAAGHISAARACMHAPAWWWAHFSADVALVPLILVFAARGIRNLAAGARLELACLAVAVVVVGTGVLDRSVRDVLPFELHTYYLFPLLVWACLRWDMRIATVVNLAITALAIGAWEAGVSTFESLPGLHSFIAISAITTLVLAALRCERFVSALREGAVHEAALDAIITVGGDGLIAELNPAAESLLGIREARALGQDAASLFVPIEQRAQVRHALDYYNHEGGEGSVTRRIRYPILRADGEEFPAEISLTRVRVQGDVWFTAFVRDITAERNAEVARRESRELLEQKVHERTLELISANEELKRRDELLRQAQSLAKLGSYDFDVVTARFQWSDELVRILGRDPATLTHTYDGVLQCVHPEDRDRVRTTLQATIRHAQPYSFEARVVRPDGSIVATLCRGRIVADERGGMQRLAGYCQDITERVRSEEAHGRLIHLVESSADAIISISLDGKIETWNAAASRIFGFVAEEVIGKSPSMLVAPDEVSHFSKMLETVHGGQAIAHYELRHRRKDGTEFEAAVAMSSICDPEGRVLGVSKVVRDITEQKAAEHRVWQSLREKEILLREIHHRVKNNLQVISSLLNLQLQRLSSAEARQALAESQSRIRSMALVHQMLYRSKDLSHINFLDYLKTVVDSLVSMYGAEASRIAHEVVGDAVNLDIDRAIVCGLIVTELVTNSLRHAFPHGGDGHVTVAARRKDGSLSLEVRDDGVGLPAAARAGAVSSFGLQIARTLTEQLEGAIEVDAQNGTAISIRFPLSPQEEARTDYEPTAMAAS